jgi:hypothetical protein
LLVAPRENSLHCMTGTHAHARPFATPFRFHGLVWQKVATFSGRSQGGGAADDEVAPVGVAAAGDEPVSVRAA